MIDDQSVKLQVCCQSIRHKLMYVDERHATPGLVDDSSDTRVFFCVRTQESLGPDGEAAKGPASHRFGARLRRRKPTELTLDAVPEDSLAVQPRLPARVG